MRAPAAASRGAGGDRAHGRAGELPVGAHLMLGRGTPWAARAGFATGSLAMDDLIAASGVASAR